VAGAVAAVLLVVLLPRPLPSESELGVWDVALRGSGR
jgi:hypothetical protein